MMSASDEPDGDQVLQRLYDLHTLMYERRAYGHYAVLERDDIKERTPEIWEWINQVFGLPHEHDGPTLQEHVHECRLVLFGRENDPKEQAKSYVAYTNASDNAEVKVVLDGWATMEEWLNQDIPDTNPTVREATFSVVGCYFLYRKSASNVLARNNLKGLLHNPVYGHGKVIPLRELRENAPPGVGTAYYQRLIVVFRCRTAKAAEKIEAHADDLIAGFITTWGLGLEEKKREIQGSIGTKHWLPAAISKAMGSMIKHQLQKGPICGFKVPAVLYALSVHAAIESRYLGSEEEFLKYIPRIPELEEQFETDGLLQSLITWLVQIARILAETRLKVDTPPIRKPTKPEVAVEGTVALRQLRLNDDITRSVFMAVLIHRVTLAV